MTVIQFPDRFRDGQKWDPLLTKRQAAAHFSRTPRWVEMMVRDHGMPSEVRGGRRWFRHSELMEWDQARKAS